MSEPNIIYKYELRKNYGVIAALIIMALLIAGSLYIFTINIILSFIVFFIGIIPTLFIYSNKSHILIDDKGLVYLPDTKNIVDLNNDNIVLFNPAVVYRKVLTINPYIYANTFKDFRLKFSVNNISEMKETASFSEEEKLIKTADKEINQLSLIFLKTRACIALKKLRWYFSRGNNGLVIKINELNPHTYRDKNGYLYFDKEVLDSKLWDKSIVYIGLKEPQKFISTVKMLQSKNNK